MFSKAFKLDGKEFREKSSLAQYLKKNFRKFIKKDIIFIIISSVTFGAYHVLGYNQELIQYFKNVCKKRG